jgi:hypothetical protein
MRTKLITALRTAAAAVENETFNYDWQKASRCNCGVVACAILGKSAQELNSALPQRRGTWTEMVGLHCPVTGIPTHEVFRSLMTAGLTQLDLVQLEWLSNPRVLEKMGKFYAPNRPVADALFGRKELSVDHTEPFYLVRYLRAWADLIQAEDASDVPQSAPVTPAEVAA